MTEFKKTYTIYPKVDLDELPAGDVICLPENETIYKLIRHSNKRYLVSINNNDPELIKVDSKLKEVYLVKTISIDYSLDSNP